MIPMIGIYLLYAAVTLRGVIVFANTPQFPIVTVCFSLYGLLLVLDPQVNRRSSSSQGAGENAKHTLKQAWIFILFLFAQTCLVVILMAVPETQDFFALLFVPLSLSVVLFFGRKTGFICIGIFSLLTILPLLRAEDGPLQGAVMGVFFSGICFLFGGYAHQIQKAAIVRNQNQRTFNELQQTYRRLQGYASQVASLAVEQERNRLARELHDSVTQTAFSMNLAAQTARKVLDQDPPRVSEYLLHLEDLAAKALSEIQTLVPHLRPTSITEEGLPVALQRLVAEHQGRGGLHVSLQVSGDRGLSAAEVAGLHSIAQEALTNVAKHSGVSEAILRLNLEPKGSSLEIEDCGVGFDPHSATGQRGHLGLASMGERANEIGWILSVESHPGRGTRILVTENRSGDPQ